MHKTWRIVKRVLWGLLFTLLFGIAAVLIGLQFRPVRGFARDQALAALRGSLKGELFVEDIRWPRLGRIEIDGLRIRDRRGVQVAALPTLLIEVRVRSLLSGRVDIDRLDVDHLFIDLADLSDQAGLLSVFASDEPPKPPSDGDMSPIAIRIRSLCLSEGALEVQPEATRQLRVRHLNTCVQLGVARSLELTLRELRAELLQNGSAVLALTSPERVPALAPIAVLPSGLPAYPAATASSMLAAISGKVRFRTSTDMAFDVRLAAREFSPATLQALGVQDSPLRAAIDADLHASAADQRIAYRVRVRAPDSDAELSGELNAQRMLWAHLVSERLVLSQIIDAQLEPLGFELDAKVNLAKPDALQAQINLVRGQYGELALPECSIEGARSNDGVVRLRTLEARYGDALLSGSGTWQPDGALQAQAKLVVPQLAAVPPVQVAVHGLTGALTTQLQLRRGAGGALDASANLELLHFAFEDNRAQRVTLQAEVSGSPEQPVVQAHLVGSQLVVANEAVAQANLDIDGGPERYRIAARVDDRRLVLDGWAAAERQTWTGGLTLSSDIGQAPIALSLPLLRFVPGERLELHELRVHFLDASAFVDGAIGLGEHDSRLRLGASVPQLAALTRQFGSGELPGRIELAGSVRGPIARPALDVKVDYSDGFKLGKQEGRVDLRILTDFKRATSGIDVTAEAGTAHVHARLASHWQRNAPPAAALLTAEHDLDVGIRGISIGALLQPSDPDLRPRVDGVVSGHLNVHGNQHKFRLQSQLATRLRALRDPTSVDLVLTTTYADAKLRAQLKVGDRRGQLLALDVSDDLNVEHWITQPGKPLELVTKTRWEASAEFAERQVRELPVVSGLGVDDRHHGAHRTRTQCRTHGRSRDDTELGTHAAGTAAVRHVFRACARRNVADGTVGERRAVAATQRRAWYIGRHHAADWSARQARRFARREVRRLGPAHAQGPGAGTRPGARSDRM
jgi:hypothetical protein